MNFIVNWGCGNENEECKCHRPFFTKVEATLSSSLAVAGRKVGVEYRKVWKKVVARGKCGIQEGVFICLLAYFKIGNLSVFTASRKASVVERVVVKIRKRRDII